MLYHVRRFRRRVMHPHLEGRTYPSESSLTEEEHTALLDVVAFRRIGAVGGSLITALLLAFGGWLVTLSRAESDNASADSVRAEQIDGHAKEISALRAWSEASKQINATQDATITQIGNTLNRLETKLDHLNNLLIERNQGK